MTQDLTEILEQWPYDPEHTMRIIVAADGRSVLQVRLPLGLEQYELEGRPDGARPYGKPTVVDAIKAQREQYVGTNGTDDGFVIQHDDCVALQNEGVLFYYRYLMLFQLNDFARVARDTGHNLALCGLLEKYCDNDEDRDAVLQFKPYIVRMNATARAMERIRSDAQSEAEQILIGAIEQIESMPEVDSPAFQFEKVRSLTYLRSAIEQIEHHDSTNPVEILRQELDEAVREENYERAAELRDRIRAMSAGDAEHSADDEY